jgi:hypothetical protein
LQAMALSSSFPAGGFTSIWQSVSFIHAVQVCVVMLHRGVDPLQCELAVHCTHWLKEGKVVLVRQTGVVPPQSALVKHLTHSLKSGVGSMEHFGFPVPAQWPSLRHFIQRFRLDGVSMRQAGVGAPQSPSPRHRWHVCVVVSHTVMSAASPVIGQPREVHPTPHAPVQSGTSAQSISPSPSLSMESPQDVSTFLHTPDPGGKSQ